VYVAVGYRSELMQKQAFLWRESNDRAFNRWCRVFENFPEGIAIVRNDENVLFSNKALAKLFDAPPHSEDG
jgi:PAS domain-containing protein